MFRYTRLGMGWVPARGPIRTTTEERGPTNYDPNLNLPRDNHVKNPLAALSGLALVAAASASDLIFAQGVEGQEIIVCQFASGEEQTVIGSPGGTISRNTCLSNGGRLVTVSGTESDRRFTVTDAEGDTFGDVLFPDADSAVIDFAVAGRRLLVLVTADNAQPISGTELPERLYESTDCSGMVYYAATAFDAIPDPFVSGFDAVFWSGSGNVVHLIESPTGPPVTINAQSVEDAATGCQAISQPVEAFSEVIAAPDIFADFPAPFTLEIQ